MRSSALVVVAILSLTACAGNSSGGSVSSPGVSGSGTPTPSASSSGVPEPTSLVWKPCTEKELDGLDCGTLVVPKNYADAGAGTFSLAVVRAKATGTAGQRIGSLFFNPGGPGVSSVSLAPQVVPALPQQLRQRFDFVTWDPRGVGRSSGLTECKDATYELPATGTVDWNSVVDQMRTAAKTSNQECAKRYPDVVPYISTNANARDLDRLRAAVGDTKLTYWGTSYGTRIGYVYGHDYPDRVRAMLLSSPVDPAGTWQSFAYGSATSPDNAVGFFFEAYPLAEQQYDRVINSLTSQALTLPSGAQVTHWSVQAIVANSVKGQSDYSSAVQLLTTVDAAIFGTAAAQTKAKAALDTMPWTQGPSINGGAPPFVGCLDYPQRMTRDEQAAMAARIRGTAPVFGWGASQGVFFCEGVDVTPDPVPVDFTNTVTPVLVMGTTRDALTQYGWATDVARTFRNSRVVTYVGTVHTPFLGAGSACVDAPGIDYLVTLKRPTVDVACPNTAVKN